MALGLSVPEAFGQRRAWRRALSAAVRQHPSQSSSLLDRMFSPGGAAVRGGDPRFGPPALRRRFAPAPIVFHHHYTSNGTYFDPYLAGSFFDPIGTANVPLNAVDAGFAAYQSANVVNSGAAASLYSYLPPSASEHPDPRSGAGPIGSATHLSAANPAPGWWPVQADPAPVTSALMQIGRAQAAPPSGYRPKTFPATTLDAPVTPTSGIDAGHDPDIGGVEVALGRGMKALRRGDFGRAVQAYRAAGRLGCADARFHVGLATAAFAVGQYFEAAEAVRADLLGSPELDRSALDIRRSYGASDVFDFHLRRLGLAARNQPDESRLWLLLGYMRFYSGDRAGGAAAWRHYSVLSPDDSLIAALID
jgi:hypothetical protein